MDREFVTGGVVDEELEQLRAFDRFDPEDLLREDAVHEDALAPTIGMHAHDRVHGLLHWLPPRTVQRGETLELALDFDLERSRRPRSCWPSASRRPSVARAVSAESNPAAASTRR